MSPPTRREKKSVTNLTDGGDYVVCLQRTCGRQYHAHYSNGRLAKHDPRNKQAASKLARQRSPFPPRRHAHESQVSQHSWHAAHGIRQGILASNRLRARGHVIEPEQTRLLHGRLSWEKKTFVWVSSCREVGRGNRSRRRPWLRG